MNESLQILVDGFTYRGDLLDIAINYAVLALCLLPHLLTKDKPILSNFWVWVLIIETVIQIWIWFSMNESGISLIWSALAGLNILLLVKANRSQEGVSLLIKQMLWLSLVAVILANIYYLITLPYITIIAHMIAMIMGMAIYGIIVLVRKGRTKST
ncbi:MAG: hypothetical protein AB8H47_24450 [Bacteroidia bacterium]